MEFKQKTSGDVPTTTTKTAVATASKKNAAKESSSVWINFSLNLETKAGTKKLSAGVAADTLFKRLFGDEFKEVLEKLSDEQIENITKKLSAESFTINIVAPSEPAKFEDLF